MKKKSSATIGLVKLCCRALAEKKAEDLRVLDVSAQSSITDYLVLATGTSEPHLRALRAELERLLKEAAARSIRSEASPESGWAVVDLFDVMVHLFTPEQRDRFRLESLWRDAEPVALDRLLAPEPKPTPTPKPKARKPAVRKKAAPAKSAKPKPKAKAKASRARR